MDLTERQKSLLVTIVREYIGSATPVSSQLIEKKYDFGVCPATIRNDMYKLTEEGFLFQPHISAGRVPSDKGYRFFVNKTLEEKEESRSQKAREVEKILRKERRDMLRLVSHLTRFLAFHSSSLAVIHLLGKDFFWKEGWEKILNEPEFEEKEVRSDFTELMRKFEKDIKSLKVKSKVKVYIGKENPFGDSRNFSIIVSRCRFPSKKKAILSLVGPKRMPYRRNLELMHSIIDLLREF